MWILWRSFGTRQVYLASAPLHLGTLSMSDRTPDTLTIVRKPTQAGLLCMCPSTSGYLVNDWSYPSTLTIVRRYPGRFSMDGPLFRYFDDCSYPYRPALRVPLWPQVLWRRALVPKISDEGCPLKAMQVHFRNRYLTKAFMQMHFGKCTCRRTSVNSIAGAFWK